MSSNWQHNGKWFKRFYTFDDAINAAKEESKRRNLSHYLIKCEDDDVYILFDSTATSSEARDALRALNEQYEQSMGFEDEEDFPDREESVTANEEYPEEIETCFVSSDGELKDIFSEKEQIYKDSDWSSRTIDDLDADYWEGHYEAKNAEAPEEGAW